MPKTAPDIYEVGLRDGFQNLEETVPTPLKVEIAHKLLESGIKRLQLGSFVSPKAVPQMADTKELAAHVVNRYPGVRFSALVPNLFGARAAWESGIREINYVVSVSLSHNKANINRTHEQSFEELDKIIAELPDMQVQFGASTSFACPFEGETSLDQLLRIVEKAAERKVNIIELADTIGMAYPTQVEQYLTTVMREFPDIKFGVHFHDTRNNGVLNSWIAAQIGVDFIQTTVGGLGGCPFAPGASGNTATEDLVWLLEKSGYNTGVDFNQLLSCAKLIKERMNGNYSGHHINIEHCN